ncbi:MAG: hypothetical protein HC811_01115 [Flammeovirgaceae bacterium]|nr:hypothetical protein [Flammeovirgaceae bacterium]
MRNKYSARHVLAAIATLATIVLSCQNEDLSESSFDLIQSRILDTSCAISGCHSSTSDPAFLQHNLVLEKSVAYSNLVGVEPTLHNAKHDNLLRVKHHESDFSLLFHKISTTSGVSNYGSPMPLGLPLLSVGQVEFIRQWIDAGAPQKGQVADPALLDDEIAQPDPFTPPLPPAPGEGIQVSVGPFSVAPDFERELFVYKKLGNTEKIFVNRFEIKMRYNSHHFILYDFNDQIPSAIKPPFDFVRDIRNPDGSMATGLMIPMAYHVFVIGSQTPHFTYQFPDGIALELPADYALDFNSHYVNKQGIPIEGEVYINLYTVPQSEVTDIAIALNLPNNSLNLPANQRTTLTKTFIFNEKRTIYSLTSHTHQLGEKFVIKIKGGARDGETVYTNENWHHPPQLNYNPPIVLNPGEGLTSEITYNNTTNKTVNFGLTSEDEMGIIFGYYKAN